MNIENQIRCRVSPELKQVKSRFTTEIDIFAHPPPAPFSELSWTRGNRSDVYPNLEIIIVNNMFWKIDENACSWVVKHEIGHLKDVKMFNRFNNFFNIAKFVGPIIGGLGGAIFTSYKPARAALPRASLGIVVSAIFSLAIVKISEIFSHRHLEYRADTFAIKHSSEDELKGGMRFFESDLQANLLCKNNRSLWETSIFSNGEIINNLLSHPSNGSRIKRIAHELKKRNMDISLSSEQDQQKIQDLKCWELWDNRVSVDIPAEQKAKNKLFKEFAFRYDLVNKT